MLGWVTQIPFDGEWLNSEPFRLAVSESLASATTRPPTWDSAHRVLTIYLAKAEQCRVRVSTYISSADLDVLGPWAWILRRDDMSGLHPWGTISAYGPRYGTIPYNYIAYYGREACSIE